MYRNFLRWADKTAVYNFNHIFIVDVLTLEMKYYYYYYEIYQWAANYWDPSQFT